MGAEMKTYKKTATIDAIKWMGTAEDSFAIQEWALSYGTDIEWVREYNPFSQKLKIPTLEGPLYASVGDFIAKGVNNEFWAIKPEIMAETYAEV